MCEVMEHVRQRTLSSGLCMWGRGHMVGLEFVSPPLNLYPRVMVMFSLLPGPSLWSRKCPLKMVTGFIQIEQFRGTSTLLFSDLQPPAKSHFLTLSQPSANGRSTVQTRACGVSSSLRPPQSQLPLPGQDSVCDTGLPCRGWEGTIPQGEGQS